MCLFRESRSISIFDTELRNTKAFDKYLVQCTCYDDDIDGRRT